MKIFVVRHAETEHNKNKIINGQTIHGSLSELGKKQADALAKRLSKEKIDIIYSSDLNRCKQTIKPYLKEHNIPIFYTELLRDRHYGEFEGKTNQEYIEWISKNNLFGNFEFKTPGGESFRDVQKRVSNFIDEILKKNNGKNILIVTHKSLVTAVMLHLLNKDTSVYAEFASDNAELSAVEINKNKRKILFVREKVL